MPSIFEKQKASNIGLALRRDEIVVVEVYTSPKATTVFRIHSSLLVQSSEYFRNALNGPWKEAHDKTFQIADVEPGIFEIFAVWLYTRQLLETSQYVNGTLDSPVCRDGVPMVLAYALADRLLAPDFRRAVNIAFISAHAVAVAPHYELIICAFQNLPEKCTILDFLVDKHCTYWEETDDSDDAERKLREQLPHGFLIRVMKKYSMMHDKTFRKLDWCKYHEHASDEEKIQCGRNAALEKER